VLIDSTIRISKVVGEIPLQYKNYDFRLFDEHGIPILEGSIKTGMKTISDIDDSLSFEYFDKNNNNLIDKDDVFVVNGLDNQTKYRFKILDRDFNQIAGIEFIAGYDQIIGNIPNIDIENKGLILGSTNKYKFEFTVNYWHPQLEINSTLYFQIYPEYDNDEAIVYKVKTGFVGAFDGVNISFFDVDNDNYLSSGDYFILEADENRLFQISILFFKEEIAYDSFRT
jgi:hypothetical protein